MKNPESTPTLTADERHALEVEYQAAVNLVAYESQLFWAIMSAFLLAETILAGFLVGQSSGPQFSVVRLIGAGVGVAGTVFWVRAILRSAGYTRLRTYQERELERRLGFTLFTRGEQFADGGDVTVDGNVQSHYRFGCKASIKNSGIALAIMFGVLFIKVLCREVAPFLAK